MPEWLSFCRSLTKEADHQRHQLNRNHNFIHGKEQFERGEGQTQNIVQTSLTVLALHKNERLGHQNYPYFFLAFTYASTKKRDFVDMC